MEKYISIAREKVSNYSMLGEMPNIDLQYIIATIIGSKATPELCGKLSKDGVKGLLDLSLEEIQGFGLSKLEATRLHSSILLVSKYLHEDRYESRQIKSPEDAAMVMMDELKDKKQEHFVVIYLDTKSKIIQKKTVFIGSLNASIVHPREVFAQAFRKSASSIIVYHNHPSGDPTPSKEDKAVTSRLAEVGRLTGVELLDHIIIGNDKFYSIKEKHSQLF